MKQPDETLVGGSRKTLLKRKSRKATSERGSKRSPQPVTILDKDVERELVKAFGRK